MFNSNPFGGANMSADQAKVMLDGLIRAINEIHADNAASLRFEELYRHGYTLVLNKFGDNLYDALTKQVAGHLQIVIGRITNAVTENFLETMTIQWDKHKMNMNILKDIFMYLDKTYARNNKKMPTYDMGIVQFRDLILKNPGVKATLQKTLLSTIHRERMGELVDRTHLKHCLRMLVDSNVFGKELYQNEFEVFFLKSSEEFYKSESADFIMKNTVPDFLIKVASRISEEENRADSYLDPSTKRKLLDILEKELIASYAEVLVDNNVSGARFLMQTSAISDLARMYQLFSRVPEKLDLLKASMNVYVKELGNNIVSDQENIKDPMRFVQNVLDLRNKFHNIVEGAFLLSIGNGKKESDRNFSRILKEAFEGFINRDSRAAHYLSAFIDTMLRKGLKGVTEAEVDEKIDQVIVIFRYLSDKDVFEDFYKKHLANRLLQGKRVSDDIEKQMISKLKTECGHQYTSKMESMFKDMINSEEFMSSFTSFLQNQRTTTSSNENLLDLTVTVLTTGCWPIENIPPCAIPVEVQRASENFKSFYMRQYSGRRVVWLTTHGSAELKCSFKKGKKELLVDTYHMCILALYNSKNEYTYKDLKDLTSIPDKELQRHMISLAHPKVKILMKSPNTKDIADDHKFSWNEDYTNPLYRVNIPLLNIVDEKANAEAPEISDSVAQGRIHSAEAATVRIMKARKTMEHNNLVIEVTKQLSKYFTVDANFIKKTIETLIDREYMERDANNRRIYHYLA